MTLAAEILTVMVMLMGKEAGAFLRDETKVDRSSMNLSSVPHDLPPTAEFLDISKNHIHQIHKGDFINVTQLKVLNVSWNNLDQIEAGTFLDTPDLDCLDLSYNRLMNLSGQQYLLSARNLVELNLAGNMFLRMELGEEFTSLQKLKRLTVGARNISAGDFKNIMEIKLQSLTIILEEELEYEAGGLENASAQILNLVFNGEPTINQDLMSDALKLFDEVVMTNLTGGYNDLISQFAQTPDFRTSNLSLTRIGIAWNDLTQLVDVGLQTSIVHLNLCDVAIFNPPFYDTKAIDTAKTTSLSIRRAVVKSFFFSQEALYNFFINLPISSIATQETPIIHMTCPKKQSPIVQLDFSNCALSDSIFSRVESEKLVECETFSNLIELSLKGNNLKHLQVLSKRVQHMRSLQNLDLSVNSLVYDGSSSCLWPSSLIVMRLASGGLTDQVFKCLPSGIETLDLQNNQISVIPASINQLRNLSALNLNSNRLRDLPVCDPFPNLNELLLKSNSIHAPSVHKLLSCSDLKILDVSHNPFTCTCALRGFISVGLRAESTTHDLQLLNWPLGYCCSYPEELRDSPLKHFWLPEVVCNVSLLAATILVPAVLLIISVLFLCRRLDVPWYMGMIWQWARAKHRARAEVKPEDLLGIEFHAFVSYSQHDEEWVKNFLFPNLEAGELKVCHHEKDFVPGKSIVENIMVCVEKSRRSVFVLSAHFVKSEWCHYELYFASHQRLSLGTDGIVLVMLEPLPQYLIPSKYYQLKSMMSRHTYLEWPQDRAKHRLFWANLRAALQADLPNAAVED